jgi:hypothetical protein
VIPSLLLSLALSGTFAPDGPPPLSPDLKPGQLPRDAGDQQPLLLGACTREDILRHREVFRSGTAAAALKPEWTARWKALDRPCVLVVAFGSWCGDTQRQLPDLLALLQDPNPFVEVRFVGVARDKKLTASPWPKGVAPQAAERVPTFWLCTLQPGGAFKLAGSVVETPPKPGQRMAEAMLDLLEKAR